MRDPVKAALRRAAKTLAANRARLEFAVLTDDEYEARMMARHYVEGESLSVIAKRHGVTPETIRTKLAAVGVDMRPATFREPAFYRDKAIRLRMQADALDTVAVIVQGCEIPPPELLARTTGGG